MLRVTVTRETATEAEPIAEVLIGKFGGSEQRGTYAARVYEPASQYSTGIDACFGVRGHERYQPALALVASILGAWRDGRVDEIGDGVRAALVNTSAKLPATSDRSDAVRGDVTGAALPSGGGLPGLGELTGLAEGGDPSARALDELVATIAALAEASVGGDGEMPDGAVVRAAQALLVGARDPAMQALANAVVAVSGRP